MIAFNFRRINLQLKSVTQRGEADLQAAGEEWHFRLVFDQHLPLRDLNEWQLGGHNSQNNGVELNAMLSEDLLKILVCPACRVPLALKENGQSLKCASCHRVYRIQDDIPVLRIDQATIEAP